MDFLDSDSASSSCLTSLLATEVKAVGVDAANGALLSGIAKSHSVLECRRFRGILPV